MPVVLTPDDTYLLRISTLGCAVIAANVACQLCGQ